MIKKEVEHLMQLPDEVFGHYLFSQDPLKGKVSLEEKEQIIQDAKQCGIKLSQELRQAYGERSIDEYINELNISLSYKESHNGLEYIYFGTYQKPNKMTIYQENIQKGQNLVVEEKIEGFENTNFQDIVKAHELFHYFEEERKDLYVNTHKITLWRFGKYEHKSKLVSQSEIAGMAFAKELLQLDFAPNVLDVVLLYPHNEEQAKRVYKNIVRHQKVEQ